MKRYALCAMLFATSLSFTACESDPDDNTGKEPEVIDFTKLSHFSGESFPEGDKWSIKDETATAESFDSLCAALEAMAAEGRSIELSFTKLAAVPAFAMAETDLSALTSLECEAATTIGEAAFSGAENLIVLELPLATTIEDGAFDNCTSLSSVTLYSAEEIDGFAGCSKLARFVAPKATTIGEKAFADNVMLTAITLESAETIEQEAFTGCINLAEVELPAATSVENKAFALCDNIETITIAQNGALTKFGDDNCNVFEGTSNLLKTALTIGSDNESMVDTEGGLLDATSIDGAVYGPFKSINSVAPSISNVTLAELSATSFPLDAEIWNISDSEAVSDDFNGLCDAIEEVSDMGGRKITLRFPNLTKLPELALEGYQDYEVRDFSALYRVELDVATELGYGAFKHCESLVSVDMQKVQIIGGSAFAQCFVMESITTPEVTTIGSYAFVDCLKLTSLSFPKTTSIGEAIFSTCRGLSSVSLPLISVASYKMFSACSGLTEVDMPLLTTIGNLSFDSCFSLAKVSFPDVTEIQNSGFANCSSLVDVNLPKVVEVCNMSFQFCSSLREISLPAATTLGGATFRGCSQLTSVSLPEVTTMGNSDPNAIAYGDFEECSSLVNIELPKVVDVGTSSFRVCNSLESVSLPSGVRFGGALFAFCEKLNYVNLAEECEVEFFGNANGDMFDKGANLSDVTLKIGYVNNGIANKGTKLLKAPTDTGVALTYGPFKAIEFANEVIKDFNALADYNENSYPVESTWEIGDTDATYEDFAGLREALLSLDPTTNHITLKFTYLTSIPAGTFKDLTAVTSVEAPVASEIGDSAFEGLTYLTSLSLPLAQTLGDNVFASCSMIMNIALPEAVTAGEGLFSNCSMINTIELPKIENIGARAFEGLGGTMMPTITIATESELMKFGTSNPDMFPMENISRFMIKIGSFNKALYDLDRKFMNFTSIGGAAYGLFAGITEVAQVLDYTKLNHYSAETYPAEDNWVIYNETATYEDLAGLREALNAATAAMVSPSQPGRVTIKLPNIKELPDNAFFEEGKEMNVLKGIELASATTVGDNALRNCVKLENVTMPEVLTTGKDVFRGCKKLYNVDMEKLTAINEGVFADCEIMYLTLPNVTSVGNRAFENDPYIMELKLGLHAAITYFGDEDGYIFGETPAITWAKIIFGEVNAALLNTTDRTIDATSIGGAIYGPFSSVLTE